MTIRIFRRYDDSDSWDEAALGTIPLTGALKFVFHTRVSGRQFYIQFGSSEIDADYKIKAYGIGYVPVAERFEKLSAGLSGGAVASGSAPLGGGGGLGGRPGGGGLLIP
jgi:hypothetical protein